MKNIIVIFILIAFASCNTSKYVQAGKISKSSNNIFANTKKVECSKDFELKIGMSFLNK